MNFQVTYIARTEEEFRKLYAEFGEAVKPSKIRRSDAELLAGMTAEEKAAGMTLEEVPPGRAPIPTKKAMRVAPIASSAPTATLDDGEEY